MGLLTDIALDRSQGIAPIQSNGVNAAAHHAEPDEEPPDLTVLEAGDLLSRQVAVVEGAAAAVEECRRECERRTEARESALAAYRLVESALDRSQTEQHTLAFIEARERLAAAEALVVKARERWEQAQSNLATADQRSDRAARDLRVAELNEHLAAPFDGTRLAHLERAFVDAKKLLEVTRVTFQSEIQSVFARLDEDERSRAELAEHGVRQRSTDPLHLLAPLLISMANAGRLRLDVRPLIGPDVHGRNPWTWHGGPLARALESLNGVALAIRDREAGAVLAAMEGLTGSQSDETASAVALQLCELLRANRDDIAIMQAVREADEPARERYEAERQASEERRRAELEASCAHAVAISEAARRRAAPHRLV